MSNDNFSSNPHLKYDQFPIYGSDTAIQNLQPTYNMGNVIEPSRDELALMQRSPYILHAKNGILTKIPAQKTLLPHDPKGGVQQIHATISPNKTIYFSHGSIISKSTDNGKTWSTHESGLKVSPNTSFQVMEDGSFVGVNSNKVASPSILVLISRDEGRTWEKLSEVDNPSHAPVRYPDILCRLSDDTLLLPIESRFEYFADPNYVHKSTDGGKTWSGPTGTYAEEAFIDTHWVGPNTGDGFLGGNCYESMITPITLDKLLAVIRYHGPVIQEWPLISPGQSPTYKSVFLADSFNQGKTWHNLRPLTNVHGQCHGFGVSLNDGSVIVTFDHRYIPGTPANKAMISKDEGATWENEVYYISFATLPNGQAGFSESVVLEDQTILTIAATTNVPRDKFLKASTSGTVGQTDVWAIRWNLKD